MDNSINKHGLKRYIPSDIRSKIRKDAGFGCAICGCVVIDYEHIDPEFHQATEHDPGKMTLLCISCHGRVTRKLISKKAVWDAKQNPKALQDGFVHDFLFVNTDEMEIKIGSSVSKNTKVILTIYGKPIIWFEPPSTEGEPNKLCAIFYDDNGKVVSYVNRNQFIAYTNNQDIKSGSTELSLVSNEVKCLLMDRKGGEALHISRMKGRYLDTTVTVNAQGSLIVKQGQSTMTLSEFRVENCGSAIHLGNPPATVKYKKLSLALMMAININTNHISGLKNETVGWVFRDEIFNRNYELVGFVRGVNVFSITNEYIGILNGFKITHKDNCYENGEPIYTSKENMEFRDKNLSIGYDVSFRLFENGI